MKKIYIILILLFITLLACDKIDEPIKEGNFVWNKRKIIIYDFTGHQCVNCPSAHNMIKDLQNLYGDSVIIPIAIHCTSFANTRPSGKFTYDFRTEIGDSLGGREGSIGFYGSLALPTGLVNNLLSEKMCGVSSWAVETQKYIASYPEFFIKIQTNFTADSTISANIKVITNIINSRKLKLIVFLTENNIIQGQEAKPNYIPDYEHNHILRAGFNSAFGNFIKNNNDKLEYNSEIIKNYSISAKNKDWKIENCSIVAFVYDAETKEILQAESKSFY